MKSGLTKRLLSLVLTAALFMGNVMPVMAEGSATVSGNDIVNTTEVVAQETRPEVPVESKSVQDIVTAGVAQDIVVNDPVQEPVVEEPVVEDTVSENEVPEEVVEEIPEEIVESDDASVSENEIQEDESVSMNEIPEEEVPLAGTLPVTLEPVTVNGITITVSGPASAFAEGTTVSAVEVEPAEVVIEAVQENEQSAVIRLKVFDINLMCDGEIVQPLNGEKITVNFEGDLLVQDEEDEEIVVYHVEDEDSVTKMETEDSEEDGSVDMITTHFSEYAVAVTIPEGFVNVTVNHYLGNEADEANRLFVGYSKLVERGGKLKTFVRRTTDYEVQRVDIVEDNVVKESPDTSIEEYTVTTGKDRLTINVYYNPKAFPEEIVPVDVFDYDDEKKDSIDRKEDSTAYKQNSINYYKNYESYKPISSFEEAREAIEKENPKGRHENRSDYEKRIKEIYNKQRDKCDAWNDILKNGANRMSTKGAYMTYTAEVDSGEKVNKYEGSNGYVVPGLLDSVDPLNLNLSITDPKYNTPNFTFEDPGFFTYQENPYGTKHILPNYNLAFDRSGTEYTLTGVVKPDGSRCNQLTKNFFPLPGGENNWFFGMRKNFEFVIGDYVGDMTYEFTGDDDLWVIMDNKVVIDLGGIHQEKTRKINIWGCLVENDPDASVTYEEKVAYLTEANQKMPHKITVLYMERGGSESNCHMFFKLPNVVVVPSTTTTVPKTNVELLKIDSVTDLPISGVGFTLFDSNGKVCQYSDLSTNDGKVTLVNLVEGTYYLKETIYNETLYEKNETVYTIVVSPDGDDVTATVSGAEYDEQREVYIIENTPIARGNLTFYKVDKYDSEKPIENVSFSLKKDDVNGEVVDTAVSTSDGSFVFENISAGTYYLQETSSLTNYKSVTKGWTIEVTLGQNRQLSYVITEGPAGLWDNDETTGRKLIKNEPYASIVFTKVDAKTDEAIGGVKFELSSYDNNAAGELPQTATSETVGNNKGTVKFDGLTIGQKYLLEETTAAEGYIAPTNPWIVEVVYENGKLVQKIYETKLTDNGATWVVDTAKEINTDAKIENTPAVGSLTIEKTVTKVDAVHGTAGFIFKIECPENEIALYRTISFTEAGKKSVTIADLPFGDYKVIELKSLRYQANDGVVEKVAKINSADGATVSYTNDKVFEKLYSHTDVKVNKVVFNADGSVTCNNQDITSTSDKTE